MIRDTTWLHSKEDNTGFFISNMRNRSQLSWGAKGQKEGSGEATEDSIPVSEKSL